ncbi:hypothetical protein SAMN05216559_1882 [Halomicrobium zhouii]|uniref:ATP-binding protein n=1 Tax=Halomicrobium zhouii TaxID=767519 RepID=A0A1I6L2B2_9EURY|nr:ATP-binding protein [Halomicrobium zhouii]SFR97599.1 hypothetical protein SAMN05216559_1882 [Halomicrobium zhouii]
MSLWNNDDAEDTPLPATDDRTYLTITPAEKPLDPSNITSSFERLHQLEAPKPDSWLPDFLAGASKPTIEWLLVATKNAIDYTVSIDPPELTDGLEHVLRDCFPTSYELTRTDVHPAVALLYDEPPTTAVEFYGHPERTRDWQTRLTPLQDFQSNDSTNHRIPLSALVATLATVDAPTVVQVLVQPYPNWTHEATYRQRDIKEGTDTRIGRLSQTVVGIAEDYEPSSDERQRLDELDAKNARRSFVVNVRALQYEHPDTVATDLQSAFSHVSNTTYEISGKRADDPSSVHEALQERTLHQPDYDNRLPFKRPQSRGIVADPAELGSFCLVDGSALTGEGTRAIDPTHGERTSIPSPPANRLARYQTHGLTLGNPITQDGTPTANSVALPPALQPLHTAWFGKTGSGKSTALTTAILDNHAKTSGADILIDPKGDGMPAEYMRAHYERFGNLENVIYFDCEQILPAFSFFDIRQDLEAGIARMSAVNDRVEHYVEILAQIMGPDRFHQAVRSPDIIRYLTKAMFDPVSGDDAFAHQDLHEALKLMHDQQRAPPVSDENLERMLAGVTSNRARTFDEIMQGVANRIEKIPVDPRLARIFNHVPEEGDPHFDFDQVLDEDVVVIVDTGGLRSEAQRALALVVLSNLWSALKRRANQQNDSGDDQPTNADAEDAPDDLPLVNCYVEEASSVAVSDLLSELLAQSRGFGCAMTLAMQFPAQLREASQRAYDEVLNNVSTVVTGNVAVDDQLARRFTTDDMTTTDVGNRLRALKRGEWLVSLPAGFDETEPRPFLCQSVDPPRGHPASERPPARAGFQQALEDVHERVQREAGIRLVEPSTVDSGDTDGDSTGDGDDELQPTSGGVVPSPLQTTQRMPPTVEYRPEVDALRCTECHNRYDPSVDGMRRVIECCSSLAEVERDDVPICNLNLKLTPEEREDNEWSDRQLMFLQAVYNAQQLRYDRLEYDLLSDSMIRLREYVGLDGDDLEALVEANLLSHDGDHPHRLYTVTPSGRKTIGESYRKGVDYGHGQGDLEESSLHVLLVEVGRRYLVQEFVEDSESPVERVVPYYELGEEDRTMLPASAAMGTDESEVEDAFDDYESRRLDVAGLDDDGDVVAAVEAERINNDVHRAVPEDFDKMADCGVEEAIWIVMNQTDGHQVLSALNDPPEGEPRVEKTYSDSTPPQQFKIDEPGLTGIYPIRWMLNAVEQE